MRLAGIDGCKAGWIAAVAEQGNLAAARLEFISDLAAFMAAKSVAFAVIDMPIGFAAGDQIRSVEPSLRGVLKGKTSSVFNAPSRAALAETGYVEASLRNQSETGAKLSKQSHALFPKMRELDAVVQRFGQSVLREGHPEVSFSLMNGAPVLSKKREACGAGERKALLAAQGFDLDRILAQHSSKICALDDALDAVALLWTAQRYAAKQHIILPPQPMTDAVGLEMSVVA